MLTPARSPPYNPDVSREDAHRPTNGAANLNPQQTIRLAVIDNDSGFVTVLSKRTEAAGWQLRQVASAIPPRSWWR